ncbi:hypothetical protein [Streptomyces sp. SAJ15]|uniref:hypothetical protein n=1 Tax=Streptomyces sp. SAJ15 TaxID=2011095 RepID=UPI0011863ACA|nr:hypothetical protein [Streptomyces sp. SAJ15]
MSGERLPSASSFIEQLGRDGVSGVTAAESTVLDGILAALLAIDRLRIDRSCIGLITGCSWNDESAQRGEDRPIKADDHSVDALRYCIRTTEALWRPHIPMTMEEAA